MVEVSNKLVCAREMDEKEIELLDWNDDFSATEIEDNIFPLPAPIVNLVGESTDDDPGALLIPLGDEGKHWTRDLSVTPNVTHNLIEMYFCAENSVACKHKREGYQLFKNGYVKIMRFIPDMKADSNTYCYMKCLVTASMRGLQYPVDACLSQDNGEVLNASCKCR